VEADINFPFETLPKSAKLELRLTKTQNVTQNGVEADINFPFETLPKSAKLELRLLGLPFSL